MNLTMAIADIETIVFREVFRHITDSTSDTNESVEQPADETVRADAGESCDPSTDESHGVELTGTKATQPSPAAADEWFTIDKIVKHKRVRSKDWYLVQWADNDSQSWIQRKDISDCAIQEYYKTRSRKKRKRKRS